MAPVASVTPRSGESAIRQPPRGWAQYTPSVSVSFRKRPSPRVEATCAIAANAAMAQVASTRGLGRFLKLTETEGVYCAHPLGGCRMADSPDLGVTDATGAIYGYEGLY